MPCSLHQRVLAENTSLNFPETHLPHVYNWNNIAQGEGGCGDYGALSPPEQVAGIGVGGRCSFQPPRWVVVGMRVGQQVGTAGARESLEWPVPPPVRPEPMRVGGGGVGRPGGGTDSGWGWGAELSLGRGDGRASTRQLGGGCRRAAPFSSRCLQPSGHCRGHTAVLWASPTPTARPELWGRHPTLSGDPDSRTLSCSSAKWGL